MPNIEREPREIYGQYRHQFERLIRESGMGDLGQLHTGPSFDVEEVPLYTLLSQVSFLDGLPILDRNRLLILAAVDHLMRIVEFARESSPTTDDFVAMVTVMGVDESWQKFNDSLLVPYWWTARPTSPSLAFFQLDPPSSPVSAFIAQTVGPAYEIYESAGRPLERVYIRPKDVPVPKSWTDPLQLRPDS